MGAKVKKRIEIINKIIVMHIFDDIKKIIHNYNYLVTSVLVIHSILEKLMNVIYKTILH